ncbi:MAG: flagellar basal body P-ring formation chaperone FlgA [Puniceicoccaceae bacterium]
MSKLFKINAAILGCLVSSQFVMAAQTPSLMSILAPVKDRPAKQVTEPAAEEKPKVAAEIVEPKSEKVEVSLQEVLYKLEAQVRSTMEDDSDLKLTSSASWKTFKVEKGSDWELVLKNTFYPDANGRWYASFDVLDGNEVVAARYLRVDASLMKEVWLTSRRLQQGDSPLEAGKTQPVMRDVFLERGTPVPVTADLSQHELSRSVSEGQLLKWEDLRIRPSVRRGGLVDVVVRQGNMTVTMRGRSLEDGLRGDHVAVRNLSSNRELVGKVIGTNQIQFTP